MIRQNDTTEKYDGMKRQKVMVIDGDAKRQIDGDEKRQEQHNNLTAAFYYLVTNNNSHVVNIKNSVEGRHWQT